ncbi:hypothetical protein R3I93_017444 [Phoxinus phoxinus]|uniref:Cystatin kininogen-type domain-containing protein n=1 Tax=Phoxinus phoxinus TaxID=58324 RepID=A0AAN9CI22_9TELE
MMRDKILVVFALAWLYCSVGHGQTDTSIPCDDKRVEDVVNLTLSTHNKILTEGAQLALYEILEATKAQNESGDVLFVRFTSRESDCPAGGDKLWHQCDYLQRVDTALRICHAKVQFTEAGQELLVHDCSAEPAISSKVAHCLGCPEKMDLHTEELREPLIHSLTKANSEVNHLHFYIFKDLTSATKQVVAGFRYKLQFKIEKSNCTRMDFKFVTEECHPMQEEKTEVLQCNSTVDVAPWRHEVPEVHVECQTGVLGGFIRFKRPPGWSPLRAMPMKPSSPVPKPKESSEESKERISPTQRAPLNCPTKPWKEFKPVTDSIAPNTTESTLPNPIPTDTALSDLDLM